MQLRRKSWIVCAKPPFGSPEHVLAYLGHVRPGDEFAAGHLPGAVHIDVADLEARAEGRSGAAGEGLLRTAPGGWLSRVEGCRAPGRECMIDDAALAGLVTGYLASLFDPRLSLFVFGLVALPLPGCLLLASPPPRRCPTLGHRQPGTRPARMQARSPFRRGTRTRVRCSRWSTGRIVPSWFCPASGPSASRCADDLRPAGRCRSRGPDARGTC